MMSNNEDSLIKEIVDDWYEKHLTSFEKKIEDTVYCNDRTSSKKAGWDKDGNALEDMVFNAFQRISKDHQPNLTCQKNDSFTVSESLGNGVLDNPVGLITVDELSYAGLVVNWSVTTSENFLLPGVGQDFWTMSPSENSLNWGANGYRVFINDSGKGIVHNNGTNVTHGVRPVISLKKGTMISSGNGLAETPFIVK